jgi:hypothetical protein
MRTPASSVVVVPSPAPPSPLQALQAPAAVAATAPSTSATRRVLVTTGGERRADVGSPEWRR